MSDAPTIVWFQRDLRLADNPALMAAIERGSPVLPVFIWSPEEEDAPWRPGSASKWWLHQSLNALRESLLRRGSNLIIRQGLVADALLRLIDETGATAVYWNRVYEPAAIARNKEMKKILREREISVESFPGNLLFEPRTIQNGSGGPFRVFTAFWNACLRAEAPPAALPAPECLQAPSTWPASSVVHQLGLLPHFDWAGGLRETWRPGEAGAAEQLRIFTKQASANYALERDRPDHTGTSRLSPHLHFGEISARQVWHALRSGDDAYRRQLGWREFAHHLLYHYPQTTTDPMRAEFSRFPWRVDAQTLKAWTEGQTGYPLVDAGMRELWHTGWMHNRVRMVAASFLVKHLLVSWHEGAAWFWDTLVDADLANNTLGWQWVAGCGADAAPYFRIFNPVIQGEKFDPNGDYIRRWVPELSALPAKFIHKPWESPEPVPAYPPPIVVHEEARERALAAFATLRENQPR